MVMTNRLQQKENDINKALAYAKASLGMEGLETSKETDELIKRHLTGAISEKQLLDTFKEQQQGYKQ